MRFQQHKVETHSRQWMEFQRLDSFFTNPGSCVHIPVREVDDARRQYDQLHNLFFAK